MIKYKWTMFILVIASIALAGCGSDAIEDKVESKGEQETEFTIIDEIESEGDNATEQEVKTDKQTMIIGKIVKIYGNYIQVDKADLPEEMLARISGIGDGDRSGQKTNSEESGTNLAAAMGGAGMPPGGGPPGGRNGSKTSTDFEFTGEIVDVMIPVGSVIRSQSDNTLELTYDSLNKGMLVRINVDSEMTIEFQSQSDDETFYADNVIVMK